MGRTLHYRTQQSLSKTKFELILKAVDEINSKRTWKLEDLKLWRGGKYVEENQAWGFTKVKNEEDAKNVIKSIQELSHRAPNLVWILLDEKDSRKITIKNGKIQEQD